MNEFEFDLSSVLKNMSESCTMPQPDEISYYKLEAKRKIWLDFDVDNNCIAIQRMIYRWNIEDKGKPKEEREPIWLYIMSYGGDLDFMWMMVDTIMESETPIYTVNVGVAASSAALIFIAGHKRFMTKRARVLIHEGSAQLAGDAVKVMDASESYKKALEKMKEYIVERTNLDKKLVNKKRSNDWELDAQFCLNNGVCDVIVENINEVL